jgi:hypothetical protein
MHLRIRHKGALKHYYYYTSSVYARDVHVYNTTAAKYGGGLFASTNGRITWSGGSFVRMNAEYAGAFDVLHGSLSVTGTRFEDCSSSNGGGCVYAEFTADASFTNCTMRCCTALNDDGGAVYVTNTASVRFESCNITNSRSVHYGGGAVGICLNGSVHMHNCRLEQNQGVTVGGAVVAQDDSLLSTAWSSTTLAPTKEVVWVFIAMRLRS